MCLLQDHAGFIWVGTENGLFRYDGRNFVRLYVCFVADRSYVDLKDRA